MRYYILKSRELYIVYEGEKVIAYYYNLVDAQTKIRKLEFIDLMYLLMNDY